MAVNIVQQLTVWEALLFQCRVQKIQQLLSTSYIPGVLYCAENLFQVSCAVQLLFGIVLVREIPKSKSTELYFIKILHPDYHFDA